ncbi:unnamed protein product [Adineta ricciae]|uniref:BZIP domain-containing protein n=1 Tax=Adineta ricciae TaxID=249248 RepID=A0A814TYK2_ADIRI|nr:unnamed protein product [Adineta ricciae]CAF1488755.1 unnamed protein product [Adineta ricciae]
MESILDRDIVLAVDMDELGVRLSNWTDGPIDESMNDYFGKEKAIDFNVFSAEIQLTTNGLKMTSDEEDSALSNDNYDIDPETGEKIFRQPTFASPPSNDKWIEEYLSEIESVSNQILPVTTNSSTIDINFDEIPFPFLENTTAELESDWLSTLIDLEETSDSNMFSDPVVLTNSEDKSNQLMTTSLSSMYIPLASENNSQSTLFNTLHPSTDDEYSTSSSSNSSRQHKLYSLDQTTFVETKLEKMEPDDDSMSAMLGRRASTRSVYQGQQDEEALQQLNIPLTVDEITQSNTEEYNRILVRLNHLSPEKLHLIKDIRRRGKNKIAAQNCRKRKAISVEALLEEVDELKRVKHDLEERKRLYQQQIEETRQQYEYLHHQVLPDRQLPPAISVQ